MKLTYFLALTLTAVFFSNCCGRLECECRVPSITLQYEAQSNCPGGFHNFVSIQAFDIDGTLVNAELSTESYECNIVIPYEANRFWVITSTDFNISDTLRVNNVVFTDSESKCCDCGDKLTDADFSINQSFYSGNIVSRPY